MEKQLIFCQRLIIGILPYEQFQLMNSSKNPFLKVYYNVNKISTILACCGIKNVAYTKKNIKNRKQTLTTFMLLLNNINGNVIITLKPRLSGIMVYPEEYP